MPKTTTKVKCSICKTAELTIVTYSDEPPDKAVVLDGAINWFEAGFGSKHDMDAFLLAICDECLSQAAPLDKKEFKFHTLT